MRNITFSKYPNAAGEVEFTVLIGGLPICPETKNESQARKTLEMAVYAAKAQGVRYQVKNWNGFTGEESLDHAS